MRMCVRVSPSVYLWTCTLVCLCAPARFLACVFPFIHRISTRLLRNRFRNTALSLVIAITVSLSALGPDIRRTACSRSQSQLLRGKEKTASPETFLELRLALP